MIAAACGLAGARAQAGPIAPEGTQPHDLDGAGKTPVQDVQASCGACHAGGADDDGKPFRPWDTWAGTMMANAVRDPLFLTALSVADQDVAGSGTYCLRCHTPTGFVKGNATGVGAALDDNDKQGVSCESCHRSFDPSKSLDGTAAPVDPKGPYAANGRLFWDPRDFKHGPYDDAVSPAHSTVGDPFTSSARLCGQCHELASPLTTMHDGGGKDLGIPFPLDTTFTEWSTSAYAKPGPDAKSCVDCHMAPAKGDALAVASIPGAKPRKAPRTHVFVGGNAWGIAMVKAAEPDLATKRAASFDAAEKAALAQLAGAVKLEVVEAPPSAYGASSVLVKLRVTNLTGHKFPTGYADGRRAWLRVELLDGAGKSLGLVGAYDDSTQTLAEDPQLHLYEAVHAQLLGGKRVDWHIALHDTLLKDSRIPPKGFVPGPTTPIVGVTFGDATAPNAYDDATIVFSLAAPIASGTDALKLRASVMYQSTQRAFVEALVAADVTDDRGKKLQAAFDATGKAAPIAIASVETKIVVSPDGADAGGLDAGADANVDAGAGGDGALAGEGGEAGKSGCGCVEAGGSGSAFTTYGLSVAACAIASVIARRRRR